MDILITGATGFIGSHLLHRLIASKHTVVIIKRKTSDTWRIDDIINKCRVYDTEKLFDLDRIFVENKIGTILHLAGKYIKYHRQPAEVQEMIESNVVFPAYLLDLAVRNNVRNFINTGTCFEYRSQKRKTKETDEIIPYDFYATTKVSFENILRYYVANYPLKATTLKLFYAYGEKDNQKLVNMIMTALCANRTLNLTPGGQNLCYTYVGDIVGAFVAAIKFTYNSPDHQYERFNIGYDRTTTVKKIVEILCRLYAKNNRINLASLPYNPREIMYLACDNRKAKTMLGWSPKVDIEKGLSNAYNYFVKNMTPT